MSSAAVRRADAAYRARREREEAKPFCSRHPHATVWVDSDPFYGTTRTCDGCYEEREARKSAEHAADYPNHDDDG